MTSSLLQKLDEVLDHQLAWWVVSQWRRSISLPQWLRWVRTHVQLWWWLRRAIWCWRTQHQTHSLLMSYIWYRFWARWCLLHQVVRVHFMDSLRQERVHVWVEYKKK